MFIGNLLEINNKLQTFFLFESSIHQLFFSTVLDSHFEKTNKMRKDYEDWLRLVVLINSGGKMLCSDILNKKEKVNWNGAF